MIINQEEALQNNDPHDIHKLHKLTLRYGTESHNLGIIKKNNLSSRSKNTEE